MNIADQKIAERMPVWRALSELFLDTELQEEDLVRIATVLAASTYAEEKIEEILRFEVTPVCKWNMFSVAGEWIGFDEDLLRARIAPRMDKRPWFRRGVFGMIRRDWQRVQDELRLIRNRTSSSPMSGT